MVVDFSAIDFKERPTLVLKNLDGTYIQPLAYAFDVHAKFMYNEVSEITFELPAYVDGVMTPHYDDVVGMRLIDWIGIGQFILVNPSRKNDGISEIKSCTAYSLEYEMTFKKIFLEEGTYNFWNPVDQENTIIKRILEVIPSWSVGEIDSNLCGKYRTLESDNSTVYDFIKNTLQDTYQCVFDFDTYQRRINVVAVSGIVETKQVFISHENLMKDIEIKEDTENIFTCLDVNGADDVDIRSVNPMGTNKIYNLDYFMETSYFAQDLIARWDAWKTTYASYQRPYFNLTVEKVLQESRLEVERAALTELQGELSTLETLQSTYVDASAQGIDMEEDLKSVKEDIAAKESEIADKEALIETILDGIDDLYQQQLDINQKCNFKTASDADGNALFSESELEAISHYIKEDAIQDDSFVYKTVSSYASEDVSSSVASMTMNFEDGVASRTDLASGNTLHTFTNGTVTIDMDGKSLVANVVRANMERHPTPEFVASVLMNDIVFDGTNFKSGCISIVGNWSRCGTNATENPDGDTGYDDGTELRWDITNANVYFTQNVTEYEKRSVEWDLFEYGQECLEELAWPSYTFSVDSANFLATDEFLLFKNQLSLGRKIYLKIGDDKILSPISIGVEFTSDDPTDFTLLFGDKYSAKDSAFQLVDLLEQSISMGQTVASNKTNYNSFIESGASTQVKEYMDSALDAAKQAVLAGKNQEIKIDESGIRLRKMLENGSGYDPAQIWMTSNSIVFTRDNWNSAFMAIGTFDDPNFGKTSGIIAPSIVGTMIAGQNMLIESSKKDGDVAVFRVDADGARLYNSRFDLVNEYGANQSGQITMMPPVGLVGGNVTSASPLFSYDENGNVDGIKTADGNTMMDLTSLSKNDLPNANFWLDMKGNAFFRGTVYANSGEFTGTVHATDGDFTGTVNATNGTFTGTINATDLLLNGVSVKNVVSAAGDASGNLDYLQIGDITIDGETGSITFNGGDVVQVRYSTSNSGPWQSEWDSSWVNTVVYAQYSYDGGSTWGASIQVQSKNGENGRDGQDGTDANRVEYIKSTYIDFTQVASPMIIANEVRTLGSFQVGRGSRTNFTALGYMGAAEGKDASGKTTYGVAISDAGTYNSTDGYVTFDTNGNYVIVTTNGCRMQSGDHSLTVTSTGAYYDGTELNTGSSSGDVTVTPVWG